MSSRRPDVTVVGSGPNGLVAAVRLAMAGAKVVVLEMAEEPGGGLRSGELVAPGYIHDHCASVHPLGAASPALGALRLETEGLEWLKAPVQIAHPLDDGTAAAVYHSVDQTVEALGDDGPSWARAVRRISDQWDQLAEDLLSPVLKFPRHPVRMAGLASALLPATTTAPRFPTPMGRALWAGIAAHTTSPLNTFGTSAAPLVLGGLAHVAGWPIAKGGSQTIADALVAKLYQNGGEIRTGHRVRSRADLPKARVTVLDTGTSTLLELFGDTLTRRWRRSLRRYRNGPGVFKVDYALSGPIPWRAGECRQSITVHLGGTIEEIVESERAPWNGSVVERPFVLLGQPTIVDPSRAPKGGHAAWAYCHVPNGDQTDQLGSIERQIERFAPGFTDLVVARSVERPLDLQQRNPNFVGGDIAAGATRGLQIFRRPVWSSDPYRTPAAGVYLCSAATPPGGGAHGMGGWNAATSILNNEMS